MKICHFENLTNKKNIELVAKKSVIDLTSRDEEIGLYMDFDKNDYIIIKSKGGEFVFIRNVDVTEKYTMHEYNNSLSGLVLNL